MRIFRFEQLADSEKEANMIELTQEQRQELNAPEPVAIDPETRETYVLLRKEVYDQLCQLLHDETLYTTAEMLDRVMAEDDANDPYLAALQKKYGAAQ
jgi:hypothetical protein